MNEPTYYKPSLDEFHIGFRVEADNDPRIEDGWDAFEIDSRCIELMTKVDSDGDYRVKVLDPDDIKELGWTLTRTDEWRFGIYILTKVQDIYKIWTQFTRDRVGQHYFYGEILNYNELKRLMERTHIIS